jgi:catecholate siderophore receptor
VIARSFEFGAKLDWLNGKLSTTAALFRTQIDNAQITDPDHPTQIVLAGNERVNGLELGVTGRLTAKWEITAGYTYLNGKTIASSVAANVGKQLANTARNAVNLWTEYEFSDHFELGVGGNYLGKRYADFAQTAVLPSYVLVDAMAAWTIDRHLTLRVNVNNLFNKLAWQNSYYSSAEENHVIPSPGRTALFTAAVKY